MIGLDSCSKKEENVFKESIFRLGVSNKDGKQVLDNSKILSFGCSEKCTFILLKDPKKVTAVEEESKESVTSSTDSGLIHYYRGEDRQWTTVN